MFSTVMGSPHSTDHQQCIAPLICNRTRGLRQEEEADADDPAVKSGCCGVGPMREEVEGMSAHEARGAFQQMRG